MDLRRRSRQADSPSSPMLGSAGASVGAAVREVARFERRSVSIETGLLAAIPVTVVLGAATAAGDPVAGVTMGAGAMLVGVAWRIRGGQPPLALMATDATLMAASTFVGCVTGSIVWLHLAVLFVWALGAGLLVALGNRGGVIGTQSLIAFVVFGRFSEPVAASAGLAGLVLSGGFAQVLFLSVVRWPPPLRLQRAAVAAAYRALAALAAGSSETSTLPAATALDDASETLSSMTLFGDPALMTLRSLVNEGHRLRVELSAIHSLMRRRHSGTAPGAATGRGTDSGTGASAGPERILQLTSEGLDLAARAIEGDRAAAAELAQHMDRLSSDTAEHALTPDASGLALSRRLAALAGQLRAVGALAAAAGEGSGLRERRPRPRASRPFEGPKADLATMRANASLQSPAGRHAIRLAVVVLVAELLSRVIPLSRSYWMVVAAATTLRPEFGATFTRGTERALGTAAGVALAGGITVAFHPAGGVTTALVGLLAWAAFATFPASYAVGFAFITALVVFLLNAISPDTLATAWARLLDTLVGGSLGLLAYAAWPTWSETSARASLADLVGALRVYLRRVLAAFAQGRRVDDSEMRDLSRRVRVGRTAAEATVARSLSEPATRRIDADQSQSMLAAMRRLAQALHVLRLDVQEEPGRRPPLPALTSLAGDLEQSLGAVEARLRTRPDEPAPASAQALPDLRASHVALERAAPDDAESEALLAELDEIVDAANGLAEMAGLEPGDRDDRPGEEG